MKIPRLFVTVIPVLFILITGCGELKYTNRDSSYNEQRNTFADLDYYGQWKTIEPFGDVWRPNAGYDWRPYDAGQWELTDRGWMWFSDEPYGWIVYHYGYWAFTDVAGWVWVPGYDWSPSRVRWSTQNDYIGWAPLPPAGWNLPNIYDENGGRFWMIVHARDFDNREINKYRVGIDAIDNPRNWNSGREPETNYIRRETGRNIEIINTQTENVRGGRRDLTRIRIGRNNQNATPSKPAGNPNDFSLPPNGSSTRVRGNGNTNNRTDGGGRGTNPNPPAVQPPKVRGDLADPVKTNPQEQQKQIIKNDGASKNNTRVIEAGRKKIKAPNGKKQKNVKTKEVKKLNPKEKKQHEADKTK